MGSEVNKKSFNNKDFIAFEQKLIEEMQFIKQLFFQHRFDNQSRRLGYELELCLVDKMGVPTPKNKEILDKANNPLFTYELATFNLEINGNPFDLTHSVFNKIAQDLSNLYQQIEQAAFSSNCELALFGVLPTLELKHLNPDIYMSDMDRYRLIDRRLIEMRGRPIHLDLQGEDTLNVEKNDIMLESLGTSLQVHYQIPADEAVDSYHAALWASMAAVAVSGNSSRVLQHSCWQESRISIFKQSVDTRSVEETQNSIIPRVHLSKGYVNSWLDLFEDNDYYSPILPEVMNCPIEELHHFNLHNGTIWRWIRPIIGSNEKGAYHLRLEYRAVPSGPTLADTIANIVFQIALTEGLKLNSEQLTKIPFESLEQDFYKVAQQGLEPEVTWCNGHKAKIKNLLIDDIIPCAYKGLKKLGVTHTEQWLDIIQQRVESGQTGAQWIKQHSSQYNDDKKLVRDYLKYAQKNIPVHQWPKP